VKVLGVVLLVVSMFVVSPAPAADAGTCYVADCHSLTHVAVRIREPHAGHRARIRVRVLTATASAATGRVVVRLVDRRGKQEVHRAAYDGAPVRVRTRRLHAGRYVVKTLFRPAADSQSGAASRATTFRVRR
jgi:hypothetical protein